MKSNRYFRHDWNARNDPKLQRLVRKLGAASKAIYWDIIEMLYEQGGKLSFDSVEDISYSNHLKRNELVLSVIKDSELFEYDDTHFWSPRQLRDSDKMLKVSEIRSEVGKRGGRPRKDVEKPNEKPIGFDTKTKTLIEYNKDNIASISPNGSIEACHPQDGMTQETLLGFEPKDEDKETNTGNIQSQDSQVLSPKQCQQVINFWNRRIDETKAALPKVKTLGEERIKKIRVRWKEFSAIGDPVEITRQIFTKACESKFFQGDNKNGWSGNFDWIFTNSKNWAKIYEGNYDNKEEQGVQPAIPKPAGITASEAWKRQVEAEERDKREALAKLNGKK